MTHNELIKQEIERIQDSGDFESLMRQVDDHYREIRYNSSQMIAILATGALPIKELDLEWGRGTGKTTVFAKISKVFFVFKVFSVNSIFFTKT